MHNARSARLTTHTTRRRARRAKLYRARRPYLRRYVLLLPFALAYGWLALHYAWGALAYWYHCSGQVQTAPACWCASWGDWQHYYMDAPPNVWYAYND